MRSTDSRAIDGRPISPTIMPSQSTTNEEDMDQTGLFGIRRPDIEYFGRLVGGGLQYMYR